MGSKSREEKKKLRRKNGWEVWSLRRARRRKTYGGEHIVWIYTPWNVWTTRIYGSTSKMCELVRWGGEEQRARRWVEWERYWKGWNREIKFTRRSDLPQLLKCLLGPKSCCGCNIRRYRSPVGTNRCSRHSASPPRGSILPRILLPKHPVNKPLRCANTGATHPATDHKKVQPMCPGVIKPAQGH